MMSSAAQQTPTDAQHRIIEMGMRSSSRLVWGRRKARTKQVDDEQILRAQAKMHGK
jgi:hypothetical protein